MDAAAVESASSPEGALPSLAPGPAAPAPAPAPAAATSFEMLTAASPTVQRQDGDEGRKAAAQHQLSQPPASLKENLEVQDEPLFDGKEGDLGAPSRSVEHSPALRQDADEN